MKKFFTLVCLAMFVASLSACGGSGGEAIRPGVKKEGHKPLSETAEEHSQTEVY